MPSTYCMYKGTLFAAAPFKDAYLGSPHYVITVENDARTRFNIVVNSASTAPTAAGDNRVYSYIDPHFDDPICAKLTGFKAAFLREDSRSSTTGRTAASWISGACVPCPTKMPTAPVSTSTTKSTIS